MKRLLRLKEPFCGISHAVGVVLSCAGLVVLLALAHGRTRYMVSFTIYGISLVTLYTASTLYHSWRAGPVVTAWLQRCDHGAIYLLIAGTYAPVCLLCLRGARGWWLLSAVYGCALAGIAVLLFWRKAPRWPRITLYMMMGWVALLVWGPLRASLPPAGIDWLLAGGVCYTVGAIILGLDRPHLVPDRFSAHDLWHLFVLAGSTCHYVLIARYLTV